MHRMLLLTTSLLATPVAAQTVAPAPTPPPPTAVPTMPVQPSIMRAPPGASANLRPPSLGQLRYLDGLFANNPRYRDSYQQAQQFGRCAAKLNTEQTEALLAARPNTTTETIQLRQLAGAARACRPYAFGAPVIFFRGGLAEAMYNRLPVGAANRPGLVTSTNIAAFRAATKAAGKARLVDDQRYTLVADCLVLQSPVAVDGVLRSRHGSADELAEMNRLLASSPGCSDVSRFPVAGGRPFLRSYLAESAYRWVNFSPVGRATSS